jgi:hypothetical protein
MYFKIVGMKYYLDKWDDLGLNSLVELKPDKNNKFDKHAIACFYQGNKIGYVAANQTKECKYYIKKHKNNSFIVCGLQGLYQPIAIDIKPKTIIKRKVKGE